MSISLKSIFRISEVGAPPTNYFTTEKTNLLSTNRTSSEQFVIYRSYPFSSLEGVTLINYVPKENSLSFDLVITPYYLKGY